MRRSVNKYILHQNCQANHVKGDQSHATSIENNIGVCEVLMASGSVSGICCRLYFSVIKHIDTRTPVVLLFFMLDKWIEGSAGKSPWWQLCHWIWLQPNAQLHSLAQLNQQTLISTFTTALCPPLVVISITISETYDTNSVILNNLVIKLTKFRLRKQILKNYVWIFHK